jgi:hypothetical protein
MKGPINIIAIKDAPHTKTTLDGLNTKWIANVDKIGLYSPQSRVTPDGAAGVINAEFTAIENGAQVQFDGEMYWGTKATSIYAYYPFSSGEFVFNAVPVQLPSVQIQSGGDNNDHVGDLDFLVSKPLIGLYCGNTGENASVSLNFNHLNTILEFQIINSNASVTISAIKLKGSNTLSYEGAEVDISQSTPASGVPYVLNNILGASNEVLLNFTTPFQTTTDYNTTPKAYMAIAPGVHIGELKILIEIDGVFKEIRRAAITFERGKKFIVKLDASSAVIPTIEGFDLEPIEINGLIWAPVNAGYDQYNRNGLLYQWHRKYGQVYSIGNQTVEVKSSMDSLDVGNSIALANTYYTITSSPYDWCIEIQNEWSRLDKYNPCPYGWRIPSKEEFERLLSTGSTFVGAGTNLGVDNLAGRWFGGNH